MKYSSVGAFACAWLVAFSALADTVTLNGGTVYQGIVVQKDENEVLLLRDYGTQWIQTSMVKSVTFDDSTRPKTLSEKTAAQSTFPAGGRSLPALPRPAGATG